MSKQNPQLIEAGFEALESENCGIYCDSSHRIAYCPIPFNGSTLIINTLLRFNDFASQIESDELKTLIRLRAAGLLTSTESAEHGDESWMRIAVIREPVERLYATFIDQAVRGDEFSDLTFSQFAQQVIRNYSCEPFDQFRSQTFYLAGCELYFDWLVPFEQLSSLLTVLEHRTGRKLSRKKMVRTGRYGGVDDPASIRGMNGRALRNLDRLPLASEMAGKDFGKEIRKAFLADFELYQNTLSKFPPRVASESEQRIFTGLRQVSSKTSDNRYPEIFRFVADRLDQTEEASTDSSNIASYGSSTGEECFSLRSHFPLATIHGFDLRRPSLDLANERNDDPKIAFHFSDEPNLSLCGPFDAIFAMSVFCRWPDVIDLDQCQDSYSFAEFQADVELLDKNLKRGGMLAIYNAMFRFTDLKLAKDYQPQFIADQPESGFVTKFSRENQRLTDQAYPYSVFRKL